MHENSKMTTKATRALQAPLLQQQPPKQPKIICPLCPSSFVDSKRLATHTARYHVSTCDVNDLAVLPFFDEANLNDSLSNVPRLNRHLDKIKRLKQLHPNNLLVLHINICSVKTKMQFLDEILRTKIVDVLFVSETFLDEDTPASFYKNVDYNIPLRRDRHKHGGGLLVFVRKGYAVKEVEKSLDFESIAFSLTIENQSYNFISSYKPPSDSKEDFICHLESLMFNFNPSEPLFIIGDLNMNLLNSDGDDLKDFMVNNELKNSVRSPTRTQTSFFKKRNAHKTSSTLIDVILHNDHDLLAQTLVIDCPFSDHCFVASSLRIAMVKIETPAIMCRCLTEAALENIVTELDVLLYTGQLNALHEQNVDLNWTRFKQRVVTTIDKYAPVKRKLLKNKNQFPWIDKELIVVQNLRNFYYASFVNGGRTNIADLELYKECRTMYQSMNRAKMKDYFASKTQKDFKNSKKFWNFYSSTIKIKSDKSAQVGIPGTILNNGIEFNGDEQISDMFNVFFTTISSGSKASLDNSKGFTAKLFNKLKRESKIRVLGTNFEFTRCESDTVTRLLTTIDTSSGPGVSCIATKVIKAAARTLVPVLTDLINMAIESCTIPIDWKTAVVTPIYKNKGVKADVNSYRGISVLPPVAKLFEKVLAEQIVSYATNHRIFFAGQYGFRPGHSCETALHQLVSDLNTIRDKKSIAMLLFIDFRKAFDLVNSDLLIHKLFHYGFGNNSLRLIENYFACRQQQTKVGQSTSSFAPISLGVPQGSVLGPLFFLLFINDLAFYLDQFKCIMFADDTTLYNDNTQLADLIAKFTSDIGALQEWCEFNRIDINWSKTFIMFVTNKRIMTPKELVLNGSKVEVVSTFKLLGVKLDDKLKFDAFTSEVRNKIVQKMHSIKKLFQLSTSVKLQFFKSFMLPYFDYCSTLSIYYAKTAIQRMCNCFNLCLFKLFGIKNTAQTNAELNGHNNKLEKFGLNTFEHRLMLKMATFVHKIVNNINAPIILKASLQSKSESAAQPTMQLRKRYQNTLTHAYITINSRHTNAISQPKTTSKAGSATFSYFFASFVTNMIVDDIHQHFNFFKSIIFNNINLLFLKFVRFFPKFDLINKNFDYLLKKKDEIV